MESSRSFFLKAIHLGRIEETFWIFIKYNYLCRYLYHKLRELSPTGLLIHIEEPALPALLRMNHRAASPATIRMNKPATVSGSGTELAAMLFPRMEGLVLTFVTFPFPRMLTEEG